jgi:hypothetical protein
MKGAQSHRDDSSSFPEGILAWGGNEIECEGCESNRFMVNPVAQGCLKIEMLHSATGRAR